MAIQELSSNDKIFLCTILKNMRPYTEKLTEKDIINIWNGVEDLKCLNLTVNTLYDKDFYGSVRDDLENATALHLSYPSCSRLEK